MSYLGKIVVVLVMSIGCARAMASTEANVKSVLKVEIPSPLSLSQSQPTVKCYTCVNCPTVTNQTQWKSCPYHLDPAKSMKCVKYAENYPQTRNSKDELYSWVIRGCASERGSCSEIKNAYLRNPGRSGIEITQLEYCYECEGDKCNGVSRSDLDMVFAFFAVVITPMLAKYTLS